MKDILVTLPEYDDTTFYCSRFSEDIVKFARDVGNNVFDIRKERVNRKTIVAILQEKNPRLVLFNGHGSDETLTGHNDEILIKTPDDISLLKSKIVHSLSCSSAKKLGKDAVEKGATTYIGYENDFIFFFDKNKTARPLEDKIATPIFEAANQIPLAIIKGNNASEAFVRSQKTYEKWINHYRLHGELLEAPQNLIALMWNKESQVVHGDKTAIL